MPPKRSSVPDLGPVKIPSFTCRQSRYPHAPQLPCLAIAQASSMGGKSNLLVKLLTEVWRHEDGKSCFSRIYVFSPRVTVDPTWRPVKEMIENEILDMRNPNHAQEFFSKSLTWRPCKKSWISSSPLSNYRARRNAEKNRRSQLFWTTFPQTRGSFEITNCCTFCIPGAGMLRLRP